MTVRTRVRAAMTAGEGGMWAVRGYMLPVLAIKSKHPVSQMGNWNLKGGGAYPRPFKKRKTEEGERNQAGPASSGLWPERWQDQRREKETLIRASC